MENPEHTEIRKMSLAELRSYFEEIDLYELRYVAVDKGTQFFFDIYSVHVAYKSEKLVVIPFSRRNLEAVEDEIYKVKTLMKILDDLK